MRWHPFENLGFCLGNQSINQHSVRWNVFKIKVFNGLYHDRYLELAKNETYVRSQDYFQVLGYISSNPVGNPIVWKFYRNEWPNLVKRFTLYHRIMGTFIAVVTNGFSTPVELEEVNICSIRTICFFFIKFCYTRFDV
mgnify:CR=1 FL=1